MSDRKPPDKFKVIKAGILKRSKDVEDRDPNILTTFTWHEGKSILKNMEIWNLPDRGIITGDDVRIAIYQLEKSGLIEIVDNNKLRLTLKGRSIAKEIWSMPIETIPDELLAGGDIAQVEVKKLISCPQCQKELELDSAFCRYCGYKLKAVAEFCSYCGAVLEPESTFCSRCGRKT
ncbi:MAG: zinc ribbon domain-containing protein [Candidatus Helarchaeota archaeon]|nr:zinc ribbon domain-containing protein [Candidatus Helarchaeota archaeon]